jgi:hypothetical protein
MKPNHLLLATLFACSLPPAFAEQAPPAPGLRALALHGPADGMPMPGLGHAPLVKNAPYSAQMVTERVQPLADGNQIERRTSAMSYRDSAGRTRHELRNPKGELRMITISDPVAGAVWILNPQQKRATRLPAAGVRSPEAREAMRARLEAFRRDPRLPAAQGSNDEQRVAVERERDGMRETVRVMRLQRGAGANPGPANGDNEGIEPGVAGAVTRALADARWASKAVSRDLGMREFDGVKAEGKARSYEIPAGELGNRNPITVADERWYAPALQVTVYAKHSDPRSGDVVYRLEGLKRGEPDAALFTVPLDYQVREAGQRGRAAAGKRGE